MNSHQEQKSTKVGVWISIGLVAIAIIGFVYTRIAHVSLRGLTPTAIAARAKGEDIFVPSTGLLKRGNPDLKEVALTIDDGPHPEYLPKILSALKSNGVHASFFLVGMKVKERPDLARAIVNSGNEVGNHSMTHPRLDTLSLDGVRNELQGCESEVKKATGKTMTLMRPPGVRYTDAILRTAKEMHFVTVAENIGAKDFILEGDYSWYPGHPGYPQHVSGVQTNVWKQLKNGGIIDLHDMPATADAMDGLIKGIKVRGYKIVTASKLIADLPAKQREQAEAAQRG